MVSLRFPFSFPQSPKPPTNGRSHHRSGHFSTVACSVAVATVAGSAVVISENSNNPHIQNAFKFLLSSFSPNRNCPLPGWGSLSLASNPTPVAEPKTGVLFPPVLGDSQRLLGTGLRRKSVMGLKNIDVYAFGVYADDRDINKVLGEKYRGVDVSELKENKELIDDLMENDISMTVRLQIVYGRLSIKSVRSAFEDSVGSRLRKFSDSDNNDLLKRQSMTRRFTSQFKDECKVPRGSIIDISRERGNVIRTTINGAEVGSIQSQLLCRSILDLYIGDDPFDQQAKENIEINLANLVQK